MNRPCALLRGWEGEVGLAFVRHAALDISPDVYNGSYACVGSRTRPSRYLAKRASRQYGRRTCGRGGGSVIRASGHSSARQASGRYEAFRSEYRGKRGCLTLVHV